MQQAQIGANNSPQHLPENGNNIHQIKTAYEQRCRIEEGWPKNQSEIARDSWLGSKLELLRRGEGGRKACWTNRHNSPKYGKIKGR